MSTLLLKIDDLVEGSVIKRPSKYIKTPYVADVTMTNKMTLPDNNNYETVLAHTASLGCCGLADVGASILMTKIPITSKKSNKIDCQEKEKLKCQYRVYLSILKEKEKENEKEIIIGIHPKLAEDLTEAALKNNLLSKLLNVKSYKRETVIFVKDQVDSRFDFSGIDSSGIPFIMEVKNVPLADYEDVTAKERKKKCYNDRDRNSKVAYFPDGYRKKTTDTVSPRALKHIQELTHIKTVSKTRCIMCYVIQRTDVNRFQPSVIDPEYRNAFIKAVSSGVEIITMVVEWNRNGEARLVTDCLPISPM
jgi:DNA-binding sugar fermentation-stimulating protein